MAEEQSSLRQAIDQIMGWPAGGGQQGGGGASPGFAPSAPASSGVDLGTTIGISNVVPEAVADPFEAQLAEIRAQNDTLAAQIAAGSAASSAAAPAASAAGEGGITYASQLRNDLASSGITGSTADQIITESLARGGYTAETAYNPSTMAFNPGVTQPVTTSMSNASYAITPGTSQYQNQYGTWQVPYLGSQTAVTSAKKSAPVNPGPKAPWQESQQYWKDLDAYTKAGGK